MNTARKNLSGAGANNTAAIVFGGDNAPSSPRPQAQTESWNGSNWTEVNDLNTGRFGLGSAGTSTNALAIGGYDFDPNRTSKTELWNGTNWTEVNDLNTARNGLRGSGIYTGALAFGVLPDHQ